VVHVEKYPRRAEQARHTRRRVIIAAIECFAEQGYPATAMTTIAERAGVAVQTLYAAFKTKRAILTEAIDVAIAGDDEPIPVNDRPWMQPVWRANDGPSTMHAYAAAVALIQGRTAVLFRSLDVAAASETELHPLWQSARDRRRLGAGGVVRAAAERTRLSQGLSIESAIDIVWALNGHEIYLSLVAGCGWSPARYETWLGHTLAQQLFTPDQAE
jgi:AcrR family transcriptional regulator